MKNDTTPKVKVSKFDLELLAKCIEIRGSKLRGTIIEARNAYNVYKVEKHDIGKKVRADIKVYVAEKKQAVTVVGDSMYDEIENFIDTIQKFMNQVKKSELHADACEQAEITTST